MTDTMQPPEEIPRSVAIIMDGNGRWAQARGQSRPAGHREGVEVVDRITEYAAEIGVEYLTMYAFSTENWNRPRLEVELLWHLLVRYLRSRTEKCLREGIRLTAVGRRDRMPARAARELARVESKTAHCDRMTLCLALDYGGLWDLQTLIQNVREADHAGRLQAGPISENQLRSMLGSSHVPDVDLLIRPGGESRTSNYLPVQLRYAELHFLSKMWPDFDEADFLEACHAYASKQRRFGAIVEAKRVRAPVVAAPKEVRA